ncbi:MAG: hypothetical protein HGA86_07825, partial [Anaerolineaceae bacterium]|nr:hypothetical protein [Anaerolineaceae bacterium]
MTLPVLATKFYLPPAGGKLVDRPRLIQQLASCSQEGGRLALVVAPAGFGKSTLAASCLQNQPYPFSWLSLDEGDNDPARFFTYLVAALQKVDPALGTNALERQRQPGPDSLQAAANILVNEIAEHEGLFLLALDDLHVITNPTIVNLINFLVDNQPQTMRSLLISREDPALPLSRLRVRRQVVEIRQADLRFSPKEAADFLNLIMGLDLTAGEIEALEQ